MTNPARWALVCGVLVIAVLVALLPRTGSGGPDDVPPGEQATSEELAAARAKAALAACPEAEAGSTPVPSLKDVRSVCLGDGSQVALGAALAGQHTVINIWATWCGPCREELPVLAAYAAGQDEVDVLAVQVASDPVDGLELLAELGVRLPSLFDGASDRGPVRAALRVPPTLPASYLVTSDGRVRLFENPRLFRSVEQIEQAVEQYGGAA